MKHNKKLLGIILFTGIILGPAYGSSSAQKAKYDQKHEESCHKQYKKEKKSNDILKQQEKQVERVIERLDFNKLNV